MTGATRTTDHAPVDPVADAVAVAITEILATTVELRYDPEGTPPPPGTADIDTASATGAATPGWQVTYVVRLDSRLARLVTPGTHSSLTELLDALPGAGVRAAGRLRQHHVADTDVPLVPALRRALRDMMAAEILARYTQARLGAEVACDLLAETVEFLIELSSTRVESHRLTHGVVVADVLDRAPRLHFAYPGDIRAAKRAPLLFDGQRSVLVVDPHGRARTELQRHRLERLSEESRSLPASNDDFIESGSLVSQATNVLGGLGFFLREDRSIWTFVDGQPLLVRRGEHWTAFPLELTAFIENMIGRSSVAALVARAAFMVSALPGGAILAIVDQAANIDGVVSAKDRYDLRNDIDPAAMRPETRLHHLIDAQDLEEQTLVRLATLDGATVLDRDGQLLAYGAIVTSDDSQHEGARTAAAKTLSYTALVVLKVSVDGDITIFRDGEAVTTLLGQATATSP